MLVREPRFRVDLDRSPEYGLVGANDALALGHTCQHELPAGIEVTNGQDLQISGKC